MTVYGISGIGRSYFPCDRLTINSRDTAARLHRLAWVFIATGIPPIVLVAFVLRYVTNKLSEACWLAKSEWQWLEVNASGTTIGLLTSIPCALAAILMSTMSALFKREKLVLVAFTTIAAIGRPASSSASSSRRAPCALLR